MYINILLSQLAMLKEVQCFPSSYTFKNIVHCNNIMVFLLFYLKNLILALRGFEVFL
jgi:hypothetical protein